MLRQGIQMRCQNLPAVGMDLVQSLVIRVDDEDIRPLVVAPGGHFHAHQANPKDANQGNDRFEFHKQENQMMGFAVTSPLENLLVITCHQLCRDLRHHLRRRL